MLGLADLPATVQVGLRLGLVAVAALAAFLVLRATVAVAMKHLLERRSQEV